MAHPTQATNAPTGSAGSALTLNSTSGVAETLVGKQRVFGGLRTLELTFTNVPIAWDDDGANGAGGYVKLFDFPEGVINIHGCVLKITSITASTQALGASASTLVASLGSAAANKTDFVLKGTEADIVPSTAMATLSSSVSAGGSGVGGGPSIGALTNSTGRTPDDTIANHADLSTYGTDAAAIESNIADLAGKINEIIAAINTSGCNRLDGRSSAKSCYLNMSADATDSVGDTDATHTVVATGTVQLVFSVIGDT